MKFFKVKEPFYYALIAAKDEEECMDLYERVVTDIEDREEFVRCLQELDQNEAIEKDAKTISEETLEPIGMEEATKEIFSIINMKINTGSTVSLTTFRLKKGDQNELIEAKIPSFVQERIDYYAKYLSKGLTYTDLYLLVTAEPGEDELQMMFEVCFGGIYLDMSYEFRKWYRDPNNWRQRQVDLANAVIHVYQQKTRKERMIV